MWACVFMSLGCLRRVGIAGPPRDSVFDFSRSHHLSSAAPAPVYVPARSASPCVCTPLPTFIFLFVFVVYMKAILVGVRQYFVVLLFLSSREDVCIDVRAGRRGR